jgi:hypothetical protein
MACLSIMRSTGDKTLATVVANPIFPLAPYDNPDYPITPDYGDSAFNSSIALPSCPSPWFWNRPELTALAP